MDQQTDAILLTPAAFEAIMLHSQAMVRRVIIGPLYPPPEECNDSCQEVRLAAWRRARSGLPPFVAADEVENTRLAQISCYREIPVAIRAWLRTTAFNQAGAAIMSRRRRAERVTRLLPLHEERPELDGFGRPRLFTDETKDIAFDNVALQAALAGLSPDARDCLLLHVVYELTVAEVAQLRDVNIETVRKRIARAKMFIRERCQATADERARQGDQR